MAKVLGFTTWGAQPTETESQPPTEQRREHQKHISILCWNSEGARRLPMAISTMITGPWHAILLQECHGILGDLRTGDRFHIVENAGASDLAIALRKTTFTHMETHVLPL